MTVQIETLSQRPELALEVAGWLKQAFRYLDDIEIGQVRSNLLSRKPPEQSFVLLADDIPAGTASFRHQDLPSHPHLTPWLSSVYVQPDYRRRGFASALVRHVEAFAKAQAVSTLWLYTLNAADLYARLGWHRVALARDKHFVVVLMCRDLITC